MEQILHSLVNFSRMRAWDPYVMQMGGARQKHNAEGGHEAKKFKNHWSRELFGGGGAETRQGSHRSFDFIRYIKTLNNYLRMHREHALLCSLEDVDEVITTI